MACRETARLAPHVEALDAPQQTPAALGFHFPAEWEEHAATWIGWPHNESDWPKRFAAIPAVYGEIVRALVGSEAVHILVNSEVHEQAAVLLLTLGGVNLSRVKFFRFPTNRGWLRDFGAICVRHSDTGEVAPLRFRFNGWAKYDNWQLDDQAGGQIVETIGGRAFFPEVNGQPIILEGGGIDGNGRGSLLTTEEWLLDPETQVRNAGFSRHDYEQLFRDYLAVSNVLWLGSGIAGDDTHGHVDDICRFVNATTVVMAMESNPRDANYRPLQENRERARDFRTENGSKLEVIELPMPAPIHQDDERFPASYANFYIGNSVVLVPTFDHPNDRVALGIIGELFPGRMITPIRATDLVLGNGTLHCLSHEQPR
jgi:agmatine deiminase